MLNSRQKYGRCFVQRKQDECQPPFAVIAKKRRSSVPIQWTDVGPKDPFVVVSAGRSLFRVEDLLSLVSLVEEINNERRK